MYQALYRKWRPQTFDQVIGQEHITRTLKNQVRTGRLSHAYLFIGTRGTGKTTCARILAKAINCENPVDGNPCGQCAACRGIAEGSVLDVVELDAASNNGVDNVRALRDEAVFSPASVKKRVYIIDEVHMLSMPAFNALLKILEEPPEHLMFILATTELQKVPATILSRCQRHSFRRIETAEIAGYLKDIAGKERIGLSEEAAQLLARMADGGVRDALSLLDQCSATENIDAQTVYTALGLAGNRRIAQLLDLILNRDSAAALRLFSEMWMDGKDPATLLGELAALLRDVLMVRVAPKSAAELVSGGYEMPVLEAFARRLTGEELLSVLELVQRSLSSLRDAHNPKTSVELCLLALCEDPAGESLSALRARISRLEEELAQGLAYGNWGGTPGDGSQGVPRPPRCCEEEPEEEEPEDELDPAMFQEEQPEDLIVKRQEPAEAAEQPLQPPQAPQAEGGWEEICQLVRAKLPMELRFSLDDPGRVRGAVTTSDLRLQVVPGFLYDRFHRQEVLEIFAQAAQSICGRTLRVDLQPLQATSQKRDLEELKGFPEVQFQ